MKDCPITRTGQDNIQKPGHITMSQAGCEISLFKMFKVVCDLPVCPL
jgi:hypothetical protein